MSNVSQERLTFYTRHYQALAEPMLALMRHGIRVDVEAMRDIRATTWLQCRRIQRELDEATGALTCDCGHRLVQHPVRRVNKYANVLKKDGKPRKAKFVDTQPCHRCECAAFKPVGASLHAETDLSPQRICHFLYTTWQLPKQHKRGEPGLTADEITLRKLRLRIQGMIDKPMRKPKPNTPRWKTNPEPLARCIDLILLHRERFKSLQYVNEDAVDIDGRLRCMYKVTTQPGRLASSENPFGTGYNLQNIPRGEMRRIFLPDPGHVLVECDFSQIEDRIVKVKSGDPAAIELARMHPSVYDAHSAAAQRMFALVLGVPENEVDVKVEVVPGSSRRQLAKPARHGANYGEGANKLQDSLLKDGVVLPIALCKRLLDAAREAYVLAYQLRVRKHILHDHQLVSSWGRVLDFRGLRLNDDTYRRGYAFWAATENADNLNQLGLVPLYRFIRDNGLASRILLQVHDSLVVSCPPDEAYDIMAFMRESMEQTREYEGVSLSVPVEFKLGSRWAVAKQTPNGVVWKTEHEWNKLPDRDVVTSAAKELAK